MKVLQYSFLVIALIITASVSLPSVVLASHDAAHCSAQGNTPVYSTATTPVYTSCTVSAVDCPPNAPSGIGTTIPCSPNNASGLINILGKVFTTMFIFLVTIASFSLLYAAFLYVTSEGEQEKIGQAKKIIIYAAVALIVAALAFGAPRAIQSFITT